MLSHLRVIVSDQLLTKLFWCLYMKNNPCEVPGLKLNISDLPSHLKFKENAFFGSNMAIFRGLGRSDFKRSQSNSTSYT